LTDRDPTAAVRLVNIGTPLGNYRSRWSTKPKYPAAHM